MLEAKTLGISVNRNWKELYEAVWRPESFGKWASGLTKSGLVRNGDKWTAQGPDGPVGLRFTGHNEFGIMDHFVDVGTGADISVPMRIIANANGAEILLTLFRQPGMSEAKYQEDASWVARDLLALKALAEV